MNAPAPDDDTVSRYSHPSYVIGSSTPLIELPAEVNLPEISTQQMEYTIPEMGDTIPEMEDASLASVELEAFGLPRHWMPSGTAVPANKYDLLAEYMRPQRGRHGAFF